MPRTATRVDMTHGPILPTAVRFALPICAGNVLQQLYSTVDTLVIGNYCDASALAAVATSSQPLEILLCIFLGIGSGVSILVSQAAGRDDADRQRELARTAVWLLYATALPLTVLGLLLGPLLLRFMQARPMRGTAQSSTCASQRWAALATWGTTSTPASCAGLATAALRSGC